MNRISPRAWWLLVVSALLQIVCFPTGGAMPVWRGIFCWVALTPLLIALLLPDRTGATLTTRQGALLGYLCGIVWYGGSCSWIYQTMYTYGGLSKPVSVGIVILFALYLGLYHALFGALVAGLRRALDRKTVGGSQILPVLLLAPFLWTAVELARARITCFPWDLLGNAAVDNSTLTALAPLAGVMGMSFVVMAGNAGIAGLVLLRGRGRTVLGGFGVALLCLVGVGGLIQIPVFTAPAPPPETAVMMQENLEVGAVGKLARPLSPSDELKEFSFDSMHPAIIEAPSHPDSRWIDSPLPSGKPATVILWPEAPSHLQSNQPWVAGGLSALARNSGSTVIAGALGVDFNPMAPRGYYLYDSALAFNAGGDYLGRYDKIHLVPWGEYIPFKEFFSFAQKLTEGVGDMDRGVSRTVFTSNGHRYGVFICYESIFGDEVRHFVLNGAEVLVNISDDGWYGESGAPWQHLNMARMRAIENNRWVLRATNTGVTTAIDPEGHIHFAAPRHVRGAFAFTFAFSAPGDGLTFYTRYGDWFAWVCAVISLLAISVSSFYAKRPTPHEVAPARR